MWEILVPSEEGSLGSKKAFWRKRTQLVKGSHWYVIYINRSTQSQTKHDGEHMATMSSRYHFKVILKCCESVIILPAAQSSFYSICTFSRAKTATRDSCHRHGPFVLEDLLEGRALQHKLNQDWALMQQQTHGGHMLAFMFSLALRLLDESILPSNILCFIFTSGANQTSYKASFSVIY